MKDKKDHTQKKTLRWPNFQGRRIRKAGPVWEAGGQIWKDETRKQ